MEFISNGMLCGRWDLDDVFAYRVYKTVIIRDRTLTFLRQALQLCIFLYVIGWAVIFEHGYLLKDTPKGAMRLSLRDPNSMSPPRADDPTAPDKINTLNYCNNTPPYLKPTEPYDRLPCVLWDYKQAVYPELEENGIFLATRVSVTVERMAEECQVLGTINCTVTVTQPKRDYYVGDVDKFTLAIQHWVYGEQSGLALAFNHLRKAVLEKHLGGNKWDPEWLDMRFPTTADLGNCVQPDNPPGPNYDPFKRDWDCLPIRKWLEAANVDLDASICDPEVSAACDHELVRHAGAVVLIMIYYKPRTTQLDELKYLYLPVMLPQAEVKVEQILWKHMGDGTVERTTIGRHGMRFIFAQTGYIGVFNFTELLKTIVTGVALFAIVEFVVNRILVRFLPKSDLYLKYMEQETVDFSDVRKQPDGKYEVVKDGKTAFDIETEDFVYGTLKRGGPKNTYPRDAETEQEGIAPLLNINTNGNVQHMGDLP
eukprot:TRINITY_DN2969_c0_g1_i1.p1 TRINITY_DN2969_c0_g1~~TRINITY_DN2969_c0_g1_i1.p1  ORF type:complete len:482 (-),score=108.85 TRINITY_DN2969_c0_g1_i1:38-1483(-)